MTDKLTLYNEALGHLKERRLSVLTENREARRVLDDFWNTVPLYCLEQGLFRFSKRVVQIDTSTTTVPAFGYNNAFTVPDDWMRTVVISTSPDLDPPLLQYAEETGYWYANATPLYVSYISSDPLYGMNLGAWPQSFADYVALRLARMACKRITGSDDLLKGREGLINIEDKARRVTKANDAMNDPPGMPPVPFWARARRGAFGPGGLWFGTGGSGGTGEN
jgi:hypothetical protein